MGGAGVAEGLVVGVGAGVYVALGVGDGPAVGLGVAVAVAVGVRVGGGAGVGVWVAVAVALGVRVLVGRIPAPRRLESMVAPATRAPKQPHSSRTGMRRMGIEKRVFLIVKRTAFIVVLSIC